jgi:hypothetical protein
LSQSTQSFESAGLTFGECNEARVVEAAGLDRSTWVKESKERNLQKGTTSGVFRGDVEKLDSKRRIRKHSWSEQKRGKQGSHIERKGRGKRILWTQRKHWSRYETGVQVEG